MTDRTPFEARLEARLLAHAAHANRPVDGATIAARVALGAGGTRRLRTWPRLGLAGGRLAAVVLVLFLLAALVGAVALVGSQLLTPAPSVPIKTLRGQFVPGPNLADVTGEYVPGIGLADGRALLVACPAVLIDPSATEPTRSGAAQVCHSGAAIATLLDGRVLVAGDAAQDTSDLAEIYDPATNVFRQTGDLLEGLLQARATTLLDGRVLISGGTLNTPNGGYAIARAELFDPATGTFAFTGSMLRPRSGHTATLLQDGRVLVTGGDGGSEPYTDAEVWDPTTGVFTATGPMTSGRQGGTATPLPDGTVLLAGGYGGIDASGGVILLATADIFDPATDTFHATSAMRVPRWLHVAAPLPDGRVLIAGGTTEPSGSGTTWTGNGIADAEIFDPRTGQFATTASMTRPRLNAIAVPLADGRVLIAGHWDGAVRSTSTNPAGPTTEVFH